MKSGRIAVDNLNRCEGETGMEVTIEDGQVTGVKLDLFEPPRFFEKFLIGRRYDEAPQLTSRICGICPQPHQLSSVQAIERALGITVSEQTAALRRLIHLGDWIQSHALHIYMLALPDYVGYDSAISMASDPELAPAVKRALRLKRLGNDIAAAIGGREVHPVTIIPGGFSALPDPAVLESLQTRLEEARQDVLDTTELVSGLSVPEFFRPCEHVALREKEGYPVNEGELVSTAGWRIPSDRYRDRLIEHEVEHANARYSTVDRDSFLVGPLARINLNFDRLSDGALRAAKVTGLEFPAYNPFLSTVVRAIELAHCLDECQAIIDRLDLRDITAVPYRVRAGEGYAVTEAPRGICCHGYRIDDAGIIRFADIVAPTSRNAYNVECDLREFVPQVLDEGPERIQRLCEMLIRAYDPCFSCSVHSLGLVIR